MIGGEQQHWGTQPQSKLEGHFCFERSVRETKGRQLQRGKHVDTMAHGTLR